MDERHVAQERQRHVRQIGGMAMNIYTCTDHDGHWPVPVASVVVANSEAEARALLMAELREHGLNEKEPFTLRQIQTESPQAFVLSDGDY